MGREGRTKDGQAVALIIVEGCAVVPQYRRGRGDYRVLWYVRVGCGSSGGNVEASFRHKKAHTVEWACSCRSRSLS